MLLFYFYNFECYQRIEEGIYLNNHNLPKMKQLKTIISILLIMLAFTVTIHGQNVSDISQFLKAEKSDATSLLKSYVTPAMNAMSNGMNNGWYTTGQVHKKLGFDLGVSLNAVFTPSSDEYFIPALSSSTVFVNQTNPGAGAPSIVGPKDKTQYTSTYDPDGNGPLPSQAFSISGPEGLDFKKNVGFSALPLPMIQLGIGTIKNTDLKIRYVPSITSGGASFQLFGIGLQHDIKQYIKGVKQLPFDLSVLFGYTSISGNSSLVSSNSSISSPDGNFKYKLSAWTLQAIISKKIAVLTLYAAAGYGSASSNVDITGTFNIQTTTVPFSVTNPLAMETTNNSGRLTGGLRLKFGPVYFSGDYTLQKYDVFTMGFGFAVR